MRAYGVGRAVAAARAVARSQGLDADDAVVLHASNKLTVRLLPCDVVARVAPSAEQAAGLELDLARQLTAVGAPVAAPDPRVEPRVYERDNTVVTLWTHYPQTGAAAIPPADYADALGRLHAGMRGLDLPVPRFTDRVERALRLVTDDERTPALAAADRELLGGTLRALGRSLAGHGGAEQVLHGEPHPGNVLAGSGGPLFTDFETVCRGPVEFDLAHAPEEVAAHCPEAGREVLRHCRLLVLAMITAWRWDRDDRFPDGRRLGTEWLARIRTAVDEGGLEVRG